MKIHKMNVSETIGEAEKLLHEEKNISPALRSVIKVLLSLMKIMLDRFSLNSKNSSKPPSTDRNRNKSKSKKTKTTRKPGGQPGHVGKQLKPIDNPDKIEILTIDRRTLPRGQYQEAGFESRQVIDFIVTVQVTEYRAQILIGHQGERFVAAFPDWVTRPVQYGPKTKSSAVYMSQYQLIPYQRIEDYFSEQIEISISTGTVFNFNQEAYDRLEYFETVAKNKLRQSRILHGDETGINISGKRLWLHTACNDRWTHFYPHAKRGHEAMNAIGILPKFKGVLCHDHWKAYYQYSCLHALCNAHHLRELEWSATEDQQCWANAMKKFLVKLNKKVESECGQLSPQKSQYYRKRYNQLLDAAEKECPLMNTPREKGRRGRMKKSKSRNLLERLRQYQDDVLRFMENKEVPFTNNQGENDLRMTKVQQKISGCFRSLDGALIFCRVRAYLITCRKHNVSATEALEILFQGKLPDFVDD
jgi:transposase